MVVYRPHVLRLSRETAVLLGLTVAISHIVLIWWVVAGLKIKRGEMKANLWGGLLCVVALNVPAETVWSITSSPSQPTQQQHRPHRPYPDRPRPPHHHHQTLPYYPYYPQHVYPSQTVVVQQPLEPVAIESLRVGDRMPPDYRYSDYAVDDYRGHGLNKPASHQRWALIAGQYYLYDLKSWQIKDIVAKR